MCDEGYACVLGVCQSCECTACGAGQVCSKNVCVDTGCETQSCMAGAHCKLGACVDDCQGATCPKGQICMAGACVGDPTAPAGDDDDPGSVGGAVSIGPLGNAGSLSFGGSAGASGNGNGNGGSGTTSPSAPLSDGTVASGCGCSLPRGGSTGWLAASLLLVALGLRRRKF